MNKETSHMSDLYDIVKNHRGDILIETMPSGHKSMQVKVVKSDLLNMIIAAKATTKEFNHIKIFNQLIITQNLFDN
jgi:hypothetical protein